MGLGSNIANLLEPLIPNQSTQSVSTPPSSQIQQFQRNLPNINQSSGKGSGVQLSGMQGNVTYPSTSGQQQMGSPNPYPNTIGQWDNSQIQPSPQFGGKGKGA